MTFPTRTDLEFFQSRQRLPGWIGRIVTKSQLPPPHALIDDVVNAHAGVRVTSGEVAVHNLLSIIRSYRRRGADVVQELRRLAEYPECAINPEKRAAFARKWARRLS